MNFSAKLSKSKIIKRIKLFAVFTLMIFPSLTFAQLSIGYGSGINLSGDQDHKFKQFNANREMISYFKTKEIEATKSHLLNLHLTSWGFRHHHLNFGIRLDYLGWTLTSIVDKRPDNFTLPFAKIEQERNAIMINIMGRFSDFNLGGLLSIYNQSYVYGGVGAGLVHSEVQHSITKWGSGIQLLAGLSVPLRANFNLQIEGRYFLAPDADAVPKKGWYVDTSGTQTPLRFNPHLDTSFYGILVGIDWQITQ